MESKRKRDITILSIAVVSLLAVGTVSFGPALWSRQRADATSSARAPTTDEVTSEAAADTFQWTMTGLLPMPGRDPFSIPIPFRLNPGGVAVRPVQPARSTPEPIPMWELPPVMPLDAPDAAEAQVAQSAASARAPAAPGPPVLTGTLVGDDPLALLEYNGERFIVRRGDRLGADFLVLEISLGHIVLARGEQQIHLILGGGTL